LETAVNRDTTSNIIKSWREYLTYRGISFEQGVSEMNISSNTNVLLSDIAEWEKGTREINIDALRYIVDEVYEYAKIQCNLI